MGIYWIENNDLFYTDWNEISLKILISEKA